MAKSCLTEGLRSIQAQSQGQSAHSRSQAFEGYARNDATAVGPSNDSSTDVGLEIRAILTQDLKSTSWEKSSFFGVSPPKRSDNGLVRDRVFGHCIPITKKQPLTEQRSASVGTA